MLLALWSAFFSESPAPPVVLPTGGGFWPTEHKTYREYLERLNGIKQKDEITQSALVDLKEIAASVEIKVPAIKKAVATTRQVIDLTAVDAEMEMIRLKLESLIKQFELMRLVRQQNEDAALVLLMC